ncbi:MAG TPA: hypothetical protein VKS79_26425 [Gemmataceae bacterium]|nr:hypothetical protein [Gemmataceae bacterium]
MTRRNVVVALVVVITVFGGWAWAQQRIQLNPPNSFGGPFAVSQVAQSAILVDTSSGKTWELAHSVDGQAVWLPGKRIDSEKEAEEWRQHEKKMRQQLDEENKLRERERRLQEREEKLKQVRPAGADPFQGKPTDTEKRPR